MLTERLVYMRINDRQMTAYQLRQEGRTYREIGERLGVTGGRARQLERQAARRLSYRAIWDAGTQFCNWVGEGVP